MICKHCGADNPEENQFCETCGTKLSEEEPSSSTKKTLSKKARIALLSCAGLVVVGGLITGIVSFVGGQSSAEYKSVIGDGDSYKEAQEYDKAETSYLDAIDLDPKQADAYASLSDVYMAQGRYEDAVNILEKGRKKCGKRKLQKQYARVYPYYGFSNYLSSDLQDQEGLVTAGDESSVSGLVSSFLLNAGGNQIPQLVTFCFSGDETPGSFAITEYDCENTDISQLDELIHSSGEDLYDQNDSIVFKKEYDDNTYIVVIEKDQTNNGSEQNVSIYSVTEDGINEEDTLQVTGHFAPSDTTCSMLVNGDSVAEPSKSEYGDEYSDYDDYDYDTESASDTSSDYDAEVKQGRKAFRECLSKYGLEALIKDDETNANSPLLNDYAQDQKTETMLFTYSLERDSMDSDTFHFTFKDYTNLEERVDG